MSFRDSSAPFWFLLCTLLISQYTSASEPQRVVLAYQENESYPYQMGRGSDVATPPGLSIDILKSAAEVTGIDAEFVRYPNKRVQILLREGLVDGAFIFSFKQERLYNGHYPLYQGDLDIERRMATLSYSLYVLDDSPLHWDGQTISEFQYGTIGANIGYSIVGDLREMGLDVSEYATESRAFQLLSLNRLDAVAAQDTTADPLIRKLGLQGIKKLYPPLKTKPYFLMLSKRFVNAYPELAEDLWDAIAAVRDQVIQQESSKYLK